MNPNPIEINYTKMLTTVLTPFAINLASAYAFKLLDSKYPDLQNSLESAFNHALETWCPNKLIRSAKMNWLKKEVEKYHKNQELFDSIATENIELNEFFNVFQGVLPGHQLAFNFLKHLKDQKNHDELLVEFKKIQLALNDIFLAQDDWTLIFESIMQYYKSLKPITALSLIEHVEKSNELIKLPIEKRDKTHAKLLHIKAKCCSFMNDTENAMKYSLYAYEHNNSDIEIKGVAARVYLEKGDKLKSSILAKEILSVDKLNPYAWSVLFILKDTDQEKLNFIKQVPISVLDNQKFRKMCYSHLVKLEYTGNIVNLDNFASIRPVRLGSIPNELTSDNYLDVVILIESEISTSFFPTNNVYRSPFSPKIDIGLYRVLTKYLEVICPLLVNTEMKESSLYYQLVLDFLNLLQTKNLSLTDKMVQNFNKLNNLDEFVINILFDSHLYTSQFKRLTDILVAVPLPCIFLKHKLLVNIAFTEISNRELLITQLSNSLLEHIAIIDENSIETILSIQYILIETSLYDSPNFLQQIQGKKETQQIFSKMIDITESLFKNQSSSAIAQKLEQLRVEIIGLKPYLYSGMANLYFLNKEFDRAVELYESYLITSQPSIDLINYLQSLYQLQNNNKTLLTLLQQLRTNFMSTKGSLEMELELLRINSDWTNYSLVCDLYFQLFKLDELILTHYIYALDQTEDKLRIDEISKKIELSIFTNNEYPIWTARTLLKYNIELGFDMLFELATNKSNFNARAAYVTEFMSLSIKNKVRIFSTVQQECYVQYRRDQSTYNIHLTHESPFLSSLIGHKVGDIVTLKKPKESFEIKISLIQDKYGALFDEISNEALDNPVSGLPISVRYVSIDSILNMTQPKKE